MELKIDPPDIEEIDIEDMIDYIYEYDKNVNKFTDEKIIYFYKWLKTEYKKSVFCDIIRNELTKLDLIE